MIAADVNSALADSKIKKESRKSRAETIRKNREEIAKIHKEQQVDVQKQIQQIEDRNNGEFRGFPWYVIILFDFPPVNSGFSSENFYYIVNICSKADTLYRRQEQWWYLFYAFV